METLSDSETIENKNVVIDIIIRKIIQRKDLNQSVVAKAVGMAPSTFHDWTYGRVPRDLSTVYKLAKFFGVSFEYLVFGEAEDQVELRERLSRLEMENAMMRLERENQMNLFETEADGVKRIQELKEQYFKKFGKRID